MKRRIKNGDLRHVAHDLAASADAHQVRGIVQRAERNALFNRRNDGIVDDDGLGKFLAAVEHPMSDGVDLRHRADHAVLRVDKTVGENSDRVRVRVHFNFRGNFSTVRRRVRVFSAWNPDSFAQSLGEDLVLRHIKQLIFQRRAAGVDHEN